MNKFNIGDRVKWYQEALGKYEAIVVGLINSKSCLLQWSHEPESRGCRVKFLVVSDYQDFQDKIDDRMT